MKKFSQKLCKTRVIITPERCNLHKYGKNGNQKNLEKWLNHPLRKPLIVWGARQVGKTYLIRDQFARQFFPENTVYIDFRFDKEIADFCSEHVNPQEIISFISLAKRTIFLRLSLF